MTRVGIGPSLARALFESIVDYAGLFPPAGLAMPEAVAAYAAARAGRRAWMLGRFVLPASRVDEFVSSVRTRADAAAPDAWPLALLAGDAASALRAQRELRHALGERARVEAVELPPAGAGLIASGAATLRAELSPDADIYIEVPTAPSDERDARLDAVARAGLLAKVRTGGLTADAFPTTPELREFIRACLARRLPFKATAGLHHACRGRYRLTYAPDSPDGVMHGYANLVLACGAAAAGASPAEIDALLEQARPLRELRPHAGGEALGLAPWRSLRKDVFRSFGSCSFDEPAGELAQAESEEE